jgi:hypothetical protein
VDPCRRETTRSSSTLKKTTKEPPLRRGHASSPPTPSPCSSLPPCYFPTMVSMVGCNISWTPWYDYLSICGWCCDLKSYKYMSIQCVFYSCYYLSDWRCLIHWCSWIHPTLEVTHDIDRYFVVNRMTVWISYEEHIFSMRTVVHRNKCLLSYILITCGIQANGVEIWVILSAPCNETMIHEGLPNI